MGIWTKCLKDDFEQKTKSIKEQICSDQRKINELWKENETLEVK
jgi:hypothetical protein